MYVVYETTSHTVKALKTHAHKHLLLFTSYLPICVLAHTQKKESERTHTHNLIYYHVLFTYCSSCLKNTASCYRHYSEYNVNHQQQIVIAEECPSTQLIRFVETFLERKRETGIMRLSTIPSSCLNESGMSFVFEATLHQHRVKKEDNFLPSHLRCVEGHSLSNKGHNSGYFCYQHILVTSHYLPPFTNTGAGTKYCTMFLKSSASDSRQSNVNTISGAQVWAQCHRQGILR